MKTKKPFNPKNLFLTHQFNVLADTSEENYEYGLDHNLRFKTYPVFVVPPVGPDLADTPPPDRHAPNTWTARISTTWIVCCDYVDCFDDSRVIGYHFNPIIPQFVNKILLADHHRRLHSWTPMLLLNHPPPAHPHRQWWRWLCVCQSSLLLLQWFAVMMVLKNQNHSTEDHDEDDDEQH